MPNPILPLLLLKGALTCAPGAPDCNFCVDHVEDRFREFAQGQTHPIGASEKPWKFSWDATYAPAATRPRDVFDNDDKLFSVGEWVPSTHIQGFVRTNNPQVPYAGTHSHKDGQAGTVFFISEDADGHKRLANIYRTPGEHHPSGMSELGTYVLFASGDDVQLVDTRKLATGARFVLRPPKTDLRRAGIKGAGGGLGMAKLADGSYLLVVSTPGSGYDCSIGGRAAKECDSGALDWTDPKGKETRRTLFYRVTGNLEKQPAPELVGEWVYGPHSAPPAWGPDAFSENLSVVTECGTGDLYTFHSTGPGSTEASAPDGYFVLSKLRTGPQGVERELRQVAFRKQSLEHCHFRSAATVHANAKHELEFACHQRNTRRKQGLGLGLIRDKAGAFLFQVFGPGRD